MKLSEFFKHFEEYDQSKRYAAQFARFGGEYSVTFDTKEDAAQFLLTGSNYGEIAYRSIVDTDDGAVVWNNQPFVYDHAVAQQLLEMAGVEDD